VLAVLTDIAVSLKTSDREWLQINREAALATFYASPDPLGWVLAFDPDHDRHPIPFSPTPGQCLQVGRDGCRNPGRKGKFSWSRGVEESRHFVKKYVDKPYNM
jgi:hypothetical protein